MMELNKCGVAATALIILLMLSLATAAVTAQEDDEQDNNNEQVNNNKQDNNDNEQVNVDEQDNNYDEQVNDNEHDNNDDEQVNGDEHDDELGMEIKREVKVKVEADKVKIESELEKENIAGEIENKFEVKFEVDGEVEIKLKYEEEFEYEDNIKIENEMKLEFRVEFESIIEFVDNNGDGLYDEGEGVSVYELEDREFTPISYTTETVDNVTVHKITTQTVDGVFKVILHVAGEFATIGGEAIRPTEVKIDIEIYNFPYTHDNSKLALESKVKSVMKTEEERKVEDVEEKITITSGDFQGFFSWKNTAMVDNVEKPVLSTELMDDPDEGKKKLYLIYERGTAIVHDPKIGVLGAIGVAPAMAWITVLVAAIVAGIVAALVSIGITRHMLRKRR